MGLRLKFYVANIDSITIEQKSRAGDGVIPSKTHMTCFAFFAKSDAEAIKTAKELKLKSIGEVRWLDYPKKTKLKSK